MVRRETPRRAVGSRGFWIALAVLFVAACGIRLTTTDRGQALLARAGLGSHFVPALGTRLDVAIARTFLDLGLLRGDIKARTVTDSGRRVREYAFTAPRHRTPTQVHVALQDAARRVHAAVLDAEIVHATKGDQLLLRVGFGRAVTHRIVVRRAAAQAEVAAGRAVAPRIALVIDDLGHNFNATTRGFLELGVPITLAILPDRPKSGALFRAAEEREIPALLHLPMEANGDHDAGPRAVRTGMSADEIDAILGRHHGRYESFIGVNNHMGSRATADRATMRAVMAALAKRDLVWVDSRTTAATVGRAAGREAGVWCLANDLFLDDGGEGREQVAANLRRLATMARRHGLAVGIAHPHPATLAALEAALPRLQAEGFAFVSVADLRPARGAAPVAQTASRR